MSSREKVPGQQEKNTLDYRGALTKSSGHLIDGPASGKLIDLGSTENTSGRQNNATRQGSNVQKDAVSMKQFLAVQEARMDSFLQHSEQQVDAQRSALRQVTDRLAGIAVSLGDIVAHWLGRPAAHQGVHLCEELENASKRYTDVERRYQELKAEHQTLQKHLQEANNKIAETVEERNELQNLTDIANWTGAAKVSDDAIRGKWKQLDYNIRAMARVLAKFQTACPTDKTNKARFDSIVSSWPKLLVNNDYKEFIITAYLWALVVEDIFQHGDKFWGGGFIGNLKNIRTDLVGKC